jgi:hypothetical protein
MLFKFILFQKIRFNCNFLIKKSFMSTESDYQLELNKTQDVDNSLIVSSNTPDNLRESHLSDMSLDASDTTSIINSKIENLNIRFSTLEENLLKIIPESTSPIIPENSSPILMRIEAKISAIELKVEALKANPVTPQPFTETAVGNYLDTYAREIYDRIAQGTKVSELPYNKTSNDAENFVTFNKDSLYSKVVESYLKKVSDVEFNMDTNYLKNASKELLNVLLPYMYKTNNAFHMLVEGGFNDISLENKDILGVQNFSCMFYVMQVYGDFSLPGISSATLLILSASELSTPVLDIPIDTLQDSNQVYIDKSEIIEKKGEETIDKIKEKAQNNTGSVLKHLKTVKDFIQSKSLYLAAGSILIAACSVVSKNPELIQQILSWTNLSDPSVVTDVRPAEQTLSPHGGSRAVVFTVITAVYYYDRFCIFTREFLVKIFGDYR